MKQQDSIEKNTLPEMFRPLLWSLRWEEIDVERDKEDIIVAAVNEGCLDHWRWIIKRYGKEEIRRVLERRLVTEIHPESLNLARLIFGVEGLRHARGSTD